MKKLLLLATVILSMNFAQAQVAKDLSIYVHSFETYFDIDVDTKVEFGDFNGDAVAVSVRGKNHIIVNKEKFYAINNVYFRYLVMYHELGHAVLNLKHTDHGIMRADTKLKLLPTISALSENRENYFQLFKIGRKKMKKQLNK